ncbi:MAG: DUF1634 domain-containing protein [Bacteroidaceae bacterium]|nr:DUF1634 domain-containing protein [Bacteroidaceae bacterium]
MEGKKLEIMVARTLRWGVSVACAIAFVGGAIYLYKHGHEALPDYTTFSYSETHPQEYTTLSGIIKGVKQMNAASWIQLGVIALLLTPILRVLLSLVGFIGERDWLYSAITAIVLAIIIGNSIGGF